MKKGTLAVPFLWFFLQSARLEVDGIKSRVLAQQGQADAIWQAGGNAARRLQPAGLYADLASAG